VIPKAFERNYLASPVVFPQPAGSAGSLLQRLASAEARSSRLRY
jgi:hypothetical protein